MIEERQTTVYILGQFAAGKSTVADFMHEELKTRGLEVVRASDFEILQELVAQDQAAGGLYSEVTEEGFVLKDNTLMEGARDKLIGAPPRGKVDIREMAVGGDTQGLVKHSMSDFVTRLPTHRPPEIGRTVAVYVNAEEEGRFSRNRKRLRETGVGVPEEAMRRFASGQSGAFGSKHGLILEEKGVIFEYVANNENGLEELQSVVKDFIGRLFGSV